MVDDLEINPDLYSASKTTKLAREVDSAESQIVQNIKLTFLFCTVYLL